ncbi:MAG: hypothetical protein WBV73_00220 [Phormidium sp.]
MSKLASVSDSFSHTENQSLGEIDNFDRQLLEHFQSKFVIQPSLTRPLVSFQANKIRPIYRWYKYKEAFSASLVEYLLQKYRITQGKILGLLLRISWFYLVIKAIVVSRWEITDENRYESVFMYGKSRNLNSYVSLTFSQSPIF